MSPRSRRFMMAFVVAGGILVATPQRALACDPSNGGCCSCYAHRHEDGWHATCCCWEEDGDFMGCKHDYF